MPLPAPTPTCAPAPAPVPAQVVHRIVVMVQANALAPTVVRAACLVARPGVDTVVLLAVVPNAHTQAAAAASMEELAAPVAALGIAHECHAVVRGKGGKGEEAGCAWRWGGAARAQEP